MFGRSHTNNGVVSQLNLLLRLFPKRTKSTKKMTVVYTVRSLKVQPVVFVGTLACEWLGRISIVKVYICECKTLWTVKALLFVETFKLSNASNIVDILILHITVYMDNFYWLGQLFLRAFSWGSTVWSTKTSQNKSPQEEFQSLASQLLSRTCPKWQDG